jgi:hypothetical protein
MGANYGLNDTLQYLEIELDSQDTDNTPDGRAATTDWPLFNLGRPLSNVAAIKILEVQIPFSYYVINDKNNTFKLVKGATTNVVTITPGNYDANTLATELQTLLNTASALTDATHTWLVVFNVSTGKFTFTSSNVTSIISFVFDETGEAGNTNPRMFLGFPKGTTTAAAGVLIAPNMALVTGPNYIYVNSTQVGQLCNVYLPTGAVNLGSGNSGPQLAKIAVDCQPGGVIMWKDPDPQKWYFLC